MLPRIFAVTTLVGALCLASAAAAQEKTKEAAPEKVPEKHEQAKAVAEQFSKALFMDLSVNDAMKLVAVPYLHLKIGRKEAEGPKPIVLKTTEAVKEEIEVLVESLNGKKLKGKMSVHENVIFDKFGLGKGEKLPEEFNKAFDQIMKRTDRVVTVRVSTTDEKHVGGFAEVVTFVAWRGSEPKVVGFVVGFSQGRERLVLDVEKVEKRIPPKGAPNIAQVKVKAGKASFAKFDGGDPKGMKVESVQGNIRVEITDEAVAGSYDIWVYDAKDGDETQTKAKFTLVLNK